MDWLINNKEWLFSGAGLVIMGILTSSWKYFGNNTQRITSFSQHNNTENPEFFDTKIKNKENNKMSLSDYKNSTKILFIDDDARFKVVKILTRSGWVHTKLIKDCDTLDDSDVVDAKILFIDVQGVGVSMGFSDEGLGLALAIKDKYKDKKVVIYSAETEGDRFHEALRKADSFLAKNADPYEFQRIVEEFTVGLGV
ncbi:hypothetical protein [Halomonas sp. M20]|uniref:hypothetical protein n=1 Tax=Halomonas sp. M20 TaxID=2763264 RepID=UPI001D0B1E82|nr:hypothetical protein [Halomonas sp. M20]